MARNNGNNRTPRWVYPAIAFVLVATVLALAHEVLIPVALAVLLAFLLAPLVRWMERARVPRLLAIIVALSVSLAGVGLIGWGVQSEIVDLAKQLPEYRTNILNKLDALRVTPQSTLGQAKKTIEDLSRHLNEAPTGEKDPATASPPQPAPEPPTVRVLESPTPPMSYAVAFLARVLHPLISAGIVVVFSVFILLKREDLRNRFIRLIGERDMHVTTPALDEAARRVSRYLAMQVLTNTGAAMLVAMGLFFLGVTNAIMWGILIGVLRFVPYIGIWIGALLMTATSIAISDGWSQPLSAFALVIGVEIVSANIVEPLLFSSGTGLSPLAVLASAVFWGWLWGPVGLVLATPLTVCVAVLGRHVQRLAFLDILLGDEPVLSTEAQLYQRMLAGDQDEASRILDAFGSEKPLADVYENLLLPALRMAEVNRHGGELDDEQVGSVCTMLGVLVEDAGDRPSAAPTSLPTAAGPGSGLVLCLPARDRGDELAARMLENLVRQNGGRAITLSNELLMGELLEQVSQHAPIAVCVSALPPAAMLHARVLCKRLRSRFPQLSIVIGLWDTRIDPTTARRTINTDAHDYVTTSLAQACGLLKTLSTNRGKPLAAAVAPLPQGH